jgi:hypothetical protein
MRPAGGAEEGDRRPDAGGVPVPVAGGLVICVVVIDEL